MTLAAKMKNLVLSLVVLLAWCITTASGQVDILKRNLPQKKDADIRYFIRDRTVMLEFETGKGVLKQKNFIFHERQFDRVEVNFRNFSLYAAVFEQEGVKPITKSLGKIDISKDDPMDGKSIEFTIHVSSDGEAKLIVETTPNVGRSLVVVLDASNVRDAIDLLKQLDDLKKEADQARKAK